MESPKGVSIGTSWGVCQSSELFHQNLAVQLVGRMQLASQDISMASFLELAKKYRLKGQTTEELCRHNSAVATSIDKHQVLDDTNIFM